MPRRCVLVAYDDVGAIDVAGPADVFTTANQLAGAPLYETQVATAAGGTSVVSESGLRLGVDIAVGAVADLDTVLVAGGLGFRRAVADGDLLDGVLAASERARRTTSVCTGAFVLAAAGLLDGRRATTHWAYADELATSYPAIDVAPDELYVRDGSVITAAGVAAAIDLALALVEADHGPALARAVSRRMVVYLHRAGGQSQFSERATSAPPDDPLQAILADVAAHPQGDHSVEQLAARAAMSRRHFARVFRSTTGTTPARWVERVRVDAARMLLESGSTSLERTAAAAGFGSVHTMRQAFGRVLGLSPAQYRRIHAMLPA